MYERIKINMREEDILYPLRRIHGVMHTTYEQLKKNISIAVYLFFPYGRKVLIPGTPEHQNLGDSAIVIAQKSFLKNVGYLLIELRNSLFLNINITLNSYRS